MPSKQPSRLNSPLLSEALASAHLWGFTVDKPPEVLGELAGGLTNSCLLVGLGQHRVVVRLNNPESALLGIHREHEARILQALDGLGVAPALLYSDTEWRFSVFEYIHGYHPSDKEWASPAFQQQLAAVIAQYQACDVNIPLFDYFGHLQGYWCDIEAQKPALAARYRDDWLAFSKQLQSAQSQCLKPVLCHHDISPQNVVLQQTGGEGAVRIRIIDWEYAGLGFAGLDIVGAQLPNVDDEEHRLCRRLKWYLDEFWQCLR